MKFAMNERKWPQTKNSENATVKTAAFTIIHIKTKSYMTAM